MIYCDFNIQKIPINFNSGIHGLACHINVLFLWLCFCLKKERNGEMEEGGVNDSRAQAM
jgi:hypothetical protein